MDRKAMKTAAKEAMGRAGMSRVLVTALVFLLLTTMLNEVVNMVVDQVLKLPSMSDMMSNVVTTDELYQAYFNYAAQLTAVMTSGVGLVCLAVTIFMGLYTWVMNFGFAHYNMKIARRERGEIHDLFYGFTMVGKVILLELLKTIFICLWCMLLFFPGMIAAFRYRMATYILLDNPEISPLEAIRRSKQMMMGYKLELFMLDLSFIGWMVLEAWLLQIGAVIGMVIGRAMGSELMMTVVGTILGILLMLPLAVWLMPYMRVTEIYFYQAALAQRSFHQTYGGYGSGGYGDGYGNGQPWQDDRQGQPENQRPSAPWPNQGQPWNGGQTEEGEDDIWN